MIQCKVAISTVKSHMIVRLPDDASRLLPSRGQVSANCMINGYTFLSVIEPDGYFGHWIRLNEELLQLAGVSVGDIITLAITPTKNWPEPEVPRDFATAIADAPQKVKDKWSDITPMARWEWVRWINATKNSDTRTIRIEKSISKLYGEHRRPCCFNLAACTDPELSKNNRLIALDSR